MKFSALSIAALATAVSSASATFTIIAPWGSSVWSAGQSGTIQWTATADEAGKLCEIHLLTGNATNATFVTNFTANGHLVPCNYTSATLHPLPDYVTGQYFVRLGENGGPTVNYGYSNYFTYNGNGTAQPDGSSIVTAPSSTANTTTA